MSILEGVLREELERTQKNIASYESTLLSLPRGYVFEQKIGDKSYCYRKYRDGNSIVSVYVGPSGSEEAKQALLNYKERKRLTENIRNLRKEEERLIKSLRHYGNRKREFDHDGLLLAEHQGKLFEKSAELGCSTAIFLRRFLHSDYLKKLDRNEVASLSLDVNEAIKSIENQFGVSGYGKTKYAKSALFWIGYLYRYISYTRQVSTKFVMRLFPYRQMNDVYYTFHTQDPEWCVRSLLEMNGQSEDIFDPSKRLKTVMRAGLAY